MSLVGDSVGYRLDSNDPFGVVVAIEMEFGRRQGRE